MQNDNDEDVPAAEDEADQAWWRESSFDLRRGLDVQDDWEATIPGELLDELVRQERQPPPGG